MLDCGVIMEHKIYILQFEDKVQPQTQEIFVDKNGLITASIIYADYKKLIDRRKGQYRGYWGKVRLYEPEVSDAGILLHFPIKDGFNNVYEIKEQ